MWMWIIRLLFEVWKLTFDILAFRRGGVEAVAHNHIRRQMPMGLAGMLILFGLIASPLLVEAVGVNSEQSSMTPGKQATARQWGKGDDTISIIDRCFGPDNVTLGYSVAFYGRVHEGKKNGGPSYTKPIGSRFDVPDDYGVFFVSRMVVNMANPKREVLEGLIEGMDRGVVAVMPDNGGKDLIDYFAFTTGALKWGVEGLGVIGIQAGALYDRFSDQLKNADGPVWYNVMQLHTDTEHHGHKDGRKTVMGLTRNAVYEVDWSVRVGK